MAVDGMIVEAAAVVVDDGIAEVPVLAPNKSTVLLPVRRPTL